MKSKRIKLVILLLLGIIGFVVAAYFSFLQIDFIGHKDPEVVKANLEKWEKILLKAEYRNGTDYYKIRLLDSTQIEVNCGNAKVGVVFEADYELFGDTIAIRSEIEHIREYINSSEMLIRENEVLYLKDGYGNFDSSKVMNIKFNKLKNSN